MSFAVQRTFFAVLSPHGNRIGEEFQVGGLSSAITEIVREEMDSPRLERKFRESIKMRQGEFEFCHWSIVRCQLPILSC